MGFAQLFSSHVRWCERGAPREIGHSDRSVTQRDLHSDRSVTRRDLHSDRSVTQRDLQCLRTWPLDFFFLRASGGLDRRRGREFPGAVSGLQGHGAG
jgi:hypothetical protein